MQSAIQHGRFDVEQRLHSCFGAGHLLVFAKTPVDQLIDG
jgi:hypothetical protein